MFLALTSVVAVWRDTGNGQFTLATAWNITNTLVFAAFIVAAFREQARNRVTDRERARGEAVRPAAPLVQAPVSPVRTTVVRPDTLEPQRAAIAGVATQDGHRA